MRIIDKRTRKILADPEKRHVWVNNQLRSTGRTVAGVVQEAGFHRAAGYSVWQRRYPRMQSIIASALEMRPQDLFPERYDECGLPLKWLAEKRQRLKPDGKNTTRRSQRKIDRQTKNDHESEPEAA